MNYLKTLIFSALAFWFLFFSIAFVFQTKVDNNKIEIRKNVDSLIILGKDIASMYEIVKQENIKLKRENDSLKAIDSMNKIFFTDILELTQNAIDTLLQYVPGNKTKLTDLEHKKE